jgi:hypothetical protein
MLLSSLMMERYSLRLSESVGMVKKYRQSNKNFTQIFDIKYFL